MFFKNIITILEYFAFFKYAPFISEIYQFYPEKISKKLFTQKLKQLVLEKKLLLKEKLVCLKDNENLINSTLKKKKISFQKIKKREYILSLIRKIPLFMFIGITGTMAMNNAEEDDDIDIFIITKSNRLWLTRLLIIVICDIFRVRRKVNDKYFSNKFCLNLFFEEDALLIPKFKQNRYVAHEILQLKPVVNRENTYERFLYLNNWIQDYFPNNHFQNVEVKQKNNHLNFFWSTLEFFAKKVQLKFINRHRTEELVFAKQLWFFPVDFQKELTKRFKI